METFFNFEIGCSDPWISDLSIQTRQTQPTFTNREQQRTHKLEIQSERKPKSIKQAKPQNPNIEKN